MVQFGFYDVSQRYEGLDGKDPLVLLANLIPWEDFRAPLRAALRKAGARSSPGTRKSRAGRKPWDEVMMFKALVLQALYNLSDDQTEYQIRDRLSFTRFLGLGLQARVPDAKTLWLYREALAQTGLVEKLFDMFDAHLRAHGYAAKGGQILDATIVQAPKQHNTKAENAAIAEGEVPAEWRHDAPKLRQKDSDARWTKKNGRSLFGYKNHVSADAPHKLIRRYSVTSAAPHDSQETDNLLDPTNRSGDVWADSAYRSKAREEQLARDGYRSHMHRRAARGHALSERAQQANTKRSRIRARIEHIFGDQTNAMGGKTLRTIGLVRAKAKIGMMNLAYNIRRFATLERLAGRCA